MESRSRSPPRRASRNKCSFPCSSSRAVHTSVSMTCVNAGAGTGTRIRYFGNRSGEFCVCKQVAWGKLEHSKNRQTCQQSLQPQGMTEREIELQNCITCDGRWTDEWTTVAVVLVVMDGGGLHCTERIRQERQDLTYEKEGLYSQLRERQSEHCGVLT